MSSLKTIILKTTRDSKSSLALLILRVGAAFLMLMQHGIPKLDKFGDMSQFSDPIGWGSSLSYILVIFAEVVCSVLLAFGLFSRLALIPLIITMLVATYIVNGGEGLASQEKSLMYLIMFVSLLIFGSGKYSIDALMKK